MNLIGGELHIDHAMAAPETRRNKQNKDYQEHFLKQLVAYQWSYTIIYIFFTAVALLQ
jgi:hypothetical protein